MKMLSSSGNAVVRASKQFAGAKWRGPGKDLRPSRALSQQAIAGRVPSLVAYKRGSLPRNDKIGQSATSAKPLNRFVGLNIRQWQGQQAQRPQHSSNVRRQKLNRDFRKTFNSIFCKCAHRNLPAFC